MTIKDKFTHWNWSCPRSIWSDHHFLHIFQHLHCLHPCSHSTTRINGSSVGATVGSKIFSMATSQWPPRRGLRIFFWDSNLPCMPHAQQAQTEHKLVHAPGLLWGASLLDPRAPQKRQEWPRWDPTFCKGISRWIRLSLSYPMLCACHWLPLEKAFMARTKSGSSSSVPIHLILVAVRCFQTNRGWHDKYKKSQGLAICIWINYWCKNYSETNVPLYLKATTKTYVKHMALMAHLCEFSPGLC